MSERLSRPGAALPWAAALGAVALALGGCAAADKNGASASTATSSTASSASGGMAGMSAATGSSGTLKPVPTQILGTATWQGMKITAQATTPVPFVVYDGTSERLVKPPSHSSFHLMVMLSDAQTNVPIPYATVWATITKAGKIVFDERQWPMISRYMGPHYGNDVTLPGAGSYQLSLLVSPPVSARHVEYQDVWLTPHRVTFTFPWKPTA